MTNFIGWIKSLYVHLQYLVEKKIMTELCLSMSMNDIAQFSSLVRHVINEEKVIPVNIVIC